MYGAYGLLTELDAENSNVEATERSLPQAQRLGRNNSLNYCVGNTSVEVCVLWGQGCASSLQGSQLKLILYKLL